MGSFGRWTAYGTVGRSIRMFYFATNLLAVMLGLAVFVYGIWLYGSHSVYAELLAPSLYVDVSRIMIVVSLLSVINSFLSVYGIHKELRCMIYSFSVASLVIFVMLFIGGIMAFVFRYKLENHIPLRIKMATSLRELYGLEDMPAVTNAWDSLQSNYKCCGVDGTEDWNIWAQSKWHMHYRTEAGEDRPRVPSSCCVPGKESFCQQSGNTTDVLFEETCYQPLRSDLLAVTYVAGWLSLVTSGVLLIPAFFAALYARLIRK